MNLLIVVVAGLISNPLSHSVSPSSSVSISLSPSVPFSADTNFIPTIRYTKDELNKEVDDVKALEKEFKEWKKAIKQKNPDYLNSVFSKLIKTLDKEHNELNNRVSERSKQMIPYVLDAKPSSTGTEDKPKVYNSDLKDQIVHVNKNDIMRKKAESEYLNKYIAVIRSEKAIIAKLKNVNSFDSTTPSATYLEISNDILAFKKEMNNEIALMKNETGKKK